MTYLYLIELKNHDLIKWGSCFMVPVKQELAGALIADWRCTYLTTFLKISDALHMKEEQPSKECLDTFNNVNNANNLESC